MKLSKKLPKDRIQVCPQCGSPDIQTDFSNAAGVVRGFLETMACNHCGHQGTFFPTIHKDQLKKPLSKNKVKNVQHFDKTFAKGFTHLFFAIMGIFLLIFSIPYLAYGYTSGGLLSLFFGAIFTATYFYIRKRNKIKLPPNNSR